MGRKRALDRKGVKEKFYGRLTLHIDHVPILHTHRQERETLLYPNVLVRIQP